MNTEAPSTYAANRCRKRVFPTLAEALAYDAAVSEFPLMPQDQSEASMQGFFDAEDAYLNRNRFGVRK